MKRLPSGRFEVPIIWMEEQELGQSYNVCYERNRQLFGKLNETQIEQFLKILRDYQDSGIITVTNKKETEGYFVPFVLVWRKSSTTPLRVCLDASQRTNNGVSANDIQVIGPRLQPDIVIQLLKFRRDLVAVIADISQMYLNILVRPEDRKFQKSILNIPGYETQQITYNILMFGGRCSPYVSQKVIKQLAFEEREQFPLGCQLLDSSTYIDDIAFSVGDSEQGKRAIQELIDGN